MLAEFDQWKKTPWRTPAGSKKLRKACSAMLASRLHVQLSLRARNRRRAGRCSGPPKFSLAPPRNGGFRACGKDTHHRDSASGDGANSARGLAKGVSEHLEGGIWGASEERESNCSSVQLAGRGDWRVLLMLPFAGRAKWRFSGGDGEKQSL